MTKAISSASDFLAAIGGKTELFTVEGVTVELRSLGWAETQSLNAQYGDNATEMTFQAALLGIVNPKLDEAQLEQFRKARPGPISDISRRIMQMSGMLKEGDGPLAGDGSLPSTAKVTEP